MTLFDDALATARQQYDALVARAALLDAGLTLANGQKAALAAEVLELRARIAKLEGPPDPPPPPPPPPVSTRTMLVGSSVQAQGMSQAEAIIKLETALGRRLGVRREYDGDGADVAWMKASAALDAGRGRVYSFKGRATEFTRAVFDAIPNDGFPTWVALQHEAERPEKGNDPAFMRQEQNIFVTNVRAFTGSTRRTDVIPTVINTGYFDRDASTATSSKDWWPTVGLNGVCLGVDPYDPNGVRSLRQQYKPSLDLWRATGGTMWGIAETGTHRVSDSDRAAWIYQGMKDAYADSASFLCWFHSDVGGNAGSGWYLEGPSTLHAFAHHLPAVTA